MTHSTKLTIGVILAVLAGGLNWMWLKLQTLPTEYVAAKYEIDQGDELEAISMMAVPIPGDASRLAKSLVPYKNRAILFGVKATRDYEPGDMVLQRDIQPPTEPTKWDTLGPFRLISVGERFKQSEAAAATAQGTTGGDNVTIAVQRDFDDKTRRLLEIIDPARNQGEGATHIVAVQVLGPDSLTDAAGLDDRDVVFQTVSLKGIANVPSVLLVGESIRFVVPAKPNY